MNRPILVAVNGQGDGEENLDEMCAEELCELAERWLARLPSDSAWRPTCAGLRSACSLFLGARNLRQARR